MWVISPRDIVLGFYHIVLPPGGFVGGSIVDLGL